MSCNIEKILFCLDLHFNGNIENFYGEGSSTSSAMWLRKNFEHTAEDMKSSSL